MASTTQNYIHTAFSKRERKWKNIINSGGFRKPLRGYDSKQDAQAEGRRLAFLERKQHLIHNMDGSIAHRRDFKGRNLPASD